MMMRGEAAGRFASEGGVVRFVEEGSCCRLRGGKDNQGVGSLFSLWYRERVERNLEGGLCAMAKRLSPIQAGVA